MYTSAKTSCVAGTPGDTKTVYLVFLGHQIVKGPWAIGMNHLPICKGKALGTRLGMKSSKVFCFKVVVAESVTESDTRESWRVEQEWVHNPLMDCIGERCALQSQYTT